MHPILLRVGPFTLYSYGAMLVVAFLTSTWLAGRAARQLPSKLRAINAEQLVDFFCVALLGGILGGRLLYVALHWAYFAQAPLELLAIWHGGLVWYGGFVGGFLGGWLYARRHRLVFLRVLDQGIPFLVLGHAMGRVGCFLNGCCYGKPTDAWCGVIFPGQTVALLPTQLFETVGLLILYVVLRRLQQPSLLRSPGRVFGVYLVSYGVLRFVLEWFRGDQVSSWMGLTLQQLISVVVSIVGLMLLLRAVNLTPVTHSPNRS